MSSFSVLGTILNYQPGKIYHMDNLKYQPSNIYYRDNNLYDLTSNPSQHFEASLDIFMIFAGIAK